jgi:hypothetical protein
MSRSTLVRSLHDVGLAAWFGGTLANAVALNAASAQPGSAHDTARVANTGWDRWTPVNAAAIGAHLIGGTGLLLANRNRVAAQKGVGTMTIVKTVVTGAALGITGYSRLLGRKMSDRPDVPVASATEPAQGTPQDVAAAQSQLRVLQWAVPALAGTVVVLGALAGEQQRPSEVQRGLRDRITSPLSRHGSVVPAGVLG